MSSGHLDHADLAHLLAYYADFLPRSTSALPRNLEIRVENESFLYVLGELADSLVRVEADSQLTWVHDEAWAAERFLHKPARSGQFLCGALPGRSKFVSLVRMPSTTTSKEEALHLLGLKGYEVFDKPGPLFVVTCALTEEVRAKARPLVPLLYKLCSGTGSGAGSGAGQGGWKVADNFGVGTVPGFTSGGSAEVVIRTFEVEAGDLVELKARGVECRVLQDA